MKNNFKLGLCIFLIITLLMGCAPRPYFRSDKVSNIKRIAVLKFQEDPEHYQKGGGLAVSGVLVTELVKLGRFAVIEGIQKEELLKEQGFEEPTEIQ